MLKKCWMIMIFMWLCFLPIKVNATEVNINLRQPQVKKVETISKKSLLINWATVKSADGYLVYRKDGEDWKKIAKVKGEKNTSYLDKKVKYGNTYCYSIVAYQKEDGETIVSQMDEEGYSITLRIKSKYKNGYKLFYDANGEQIKDVSGIIGKRKSYVLKVNTESCVTTVYAKDGKKGYTIPVKAYLCSPGRYTASGNFDTKVRYRYRALFYSSYSQWTVQIHGNILFHTVPYKKSQNKTALDVKEYNKLGTAASHGCVRLQCDAVKWIYDNCKAGTKVVIYRSKNPGPLGKPKLQKLPSWHTWDPTDPTCEKLCKKHKCHY